MTKVIIERKAFLEHNQKPKEDYDLLDLMLTTPMARDDNGKEIHMSDELIRANLTTILSAGHSTTTSMLSWCLNYLFDSNLGNTDCRYKVIQEIDALSGGDRDYIPDLNDIYKKLPYLTATLKVS
jgi:cytochrome P450 / NADPH-cytochrome P450 reductase